MPPLLGTHITIYLPPLLLLLVCHVASVSDGSLCYLCHGEELPLPLPCVGGGVPLQLERRWKNNSIFTYVWKQIEENFE